MVRLIESTQTALTGLKADTVTAADTKTLETPLATPKWVTPMLLFIDLYEKVKMFFFKHKTLKLIFVLGQNGAYRRYPNYSVTFLSRMWVL